MESIEKIFGSNSIWFNGFVMTGVILILVGIKNVTMREMRQYNLSHSNVHKIDEIIAWGIFYIIFGILIAAGTIVSIIIYRK
jgi:hypothetical protein